MPRKKISETTLVSNYGQPKVSYGKSTGLLRWKPSLTFVIGGGSGLHVSIVADDDWCMAQMQFESGDETYDEDTNRLHTTIGEISFDSFHVTADGGGSTFMNLHGEVISSDGPKEAKEAALRISKDVIGVVKKEGKEKEKS